MDKAVLFIGNHLSSSKSNITVAEEIEGRLIQKNWKILSTSNKKNKIIRLIDIFSTIILKKNHYHLTIINVFSGNAFIWAYLSGILLKHLRKPIILVLHGGNLPIFSKKHPYEIKQIFSWASKIISPSRFLQISLKSFHSNIEIISNPIELRDYAFISRSRLNARLIWLRAFHRIYNPFLVPKVVSILKNQILDPKVTMIGPDKNDGSLQETKILAKNLSVENYIKIISGISKERVPSYLNQGDIFINTTNIDNMPVSVIEAMACGLCIVSTNVGGIPYLLENEIDALLVPPDDPEAMAAAIQRILNEPGLATRLSNNARKKAEQFDWSIILPQWEKVFEEVQQYYL